MAKVNLSQLSACVEDARIAWLDTDRGPAAPTPYAPLLTRLAAAVGKLPPLYRDATAEPFLAAIEHLGAAQFTDVLKKDPKGEGTAGLMLDIAQSILQHGAGQQQRPLAAFQELISDCYDGFLSAEDRRGVRPPDFEIIAPLVKWGNPDSGPYTWPVDATRTFGLTAGVVNLPPANARHGLCAWAALGHECGGRAILHADRGLLTELCDRVHAALIKAKLGPRISDYWSSRIDATASDVLGVLSLGPAAGVGLIACCRGINAALGWGPTVSSEGPADDPHPTDLVRAYLAAQTVRRLGFSGAKAWADAIAAETDRDAAKIVLAGTEVTQAQATQAAAVVAGTIAMERLTALDGHAFGQIQNWCDHDEDVVAELKPMLTAKLAAPVSFASDAYAAHVVAAAVVLALEGAAPIPRLFARLLAGMEAMHDANPSWGALYVVHPGDIARDRVFSKRAFGGRRRSVRTSARRGHRNRGADRPPADHQP